MIPTPAEILERIKDGTLLPPDVIGSLDHDDILDRRDGDPEFETQWTRVYKEIEARWPTANVDDGVASLADDVRRESFLAVSRATSQHEIASYVSDDFDLITRGSILGVNDAFLKNLWETYHRNEIPTPANDE